MSHTLSPKGEAEYAKARLAAYVAELDRIREVRGDRPLDRHAHLSAWENASNSVDRSKFA